MFLFFKLHVVGILSLLNIMTRRFVTHESLSHEKLHKNLEVVEMFQRIGWLELFLRMDGYDEGIAKEFV